MKISEFDYDLPGSLIAKHPPKIRGASRLLVLDKTSGALKDKLYKDIPDYLNAGDVLVLNDTKVIKARLIVTKQNGSERELIVLEKHGKDDDWFEHKVMYRGSMKVGDILHIGKVKIWVEEIIGNGLAIVKGSQDLLEITKNFGNVPLPPYLHRDATAEDIKRYQTVWAEQIGSVAAPTASLNMTTNILDRLQDKGIRIVYLTLHVGLGTFMPIRSDDVEGHTMHQEYLEIPASTIKVIKEAKQDDKKVVALGTTVARSLEYSASQILDHPAKLISGEADIFIYPGHKFKMIDSLITNFHASRSTVLMMAAAFAGWQNLKNAYSFAIDNNYRFLSYGDSMLIE
jgi:S-adenosylmethionine:tRNA ribosyltransferase-isomerase